MAPQSLLLLPPSSAGSLPITQQRSGRRTFFSAQGSAPRQHCRPRRRAACSASVDRDPFFDASMAMFDRQIALMDREMGLASREMDAEVGRMMGWARRAEADALAQAERALAQARQQGAQQQQGVTVVDQPGVQIRRSEERGPNSYRYFESISITSGGTSRYAYPPAHTAAAVGPSPLLFIAALLAGAYAALAARFAKNFELTTYQARSKWPLVLLFPLLLVASPQFREQFLAAVRGLRAGGGKGGDPGAATRSADGL